MKPSKAIAILTIPLAICWMVLLVGMCLTPYWDCKVQLPLISLDIWKPALFGLLLFSIVAAVVLYVDLLLIKQLVPRIVRYQSVAIAVIGGIVATLPRILFGAFSGQGIGVSPQVEFLPFAIAGAVFALVLHWLLTNSRK